MPTRSSFESKVLVAFGAAALVVAALTATTFKIARDAADAARSVAHTHEVLEDLVGTRLDTLQIEFSTQAFRVLNDPTRLIERDTAIASREVRMEKIRQLTIYDARQQERWKLLRAVLDQRLAMSRRIELLRKTRGLQAASAYVAGAPLQETRERSSGLLREMEEQERRLLQMRSTEQLNARQNLVTADTAVAILLAALLTATYVFILRQLRQTEANRRALADSEQSLAITLHSIGDAVLATDTQGRVTRMNPEAERLTGWPLVEARSRAIEEVFRIINEQTGEPAEIPVTKALATGEAQELASDTALIARDGSVCSINDSAAPIKDSRGRLSGVVLVFRDVTLRRQAQRTVSEQNELLEQRVRERTAQLVHVSRALRTLSAGNRTMLRATDEQGLLDAMCEAIVNEGGYHMAVVWYGDPGDPSSLRPMAESGDAAGLDTLRSLKRNWTDAEHEAGLIGSAIRTGQASVVRNMATEPIYAPLYPHLKDRVSGIACPLRTDGNVIGALAIYGAEQDALDSNEVQLLTESADDLAYGIATLRARVEQQAQQETVHRLSRFDVLTGLPNETQFAEFLLAAIASGQRLNQPFAVLQTNIERLSEINDALGFGQGDLLLREFGARMRAAAPTTAQVARLRGDEFAILLPDAEAKGALAVVQGLERVLAQPFQMADISLEVSIRTGIALFPEHGASPHDLFRHMDIAVNEAKTKGVAHLVFNPAGNMHHPSRLTMPGELRRAIEGSELVLYLQPKVEMASGRVCGAEGLVRWQHPERGLLQPGEFIALAEQTGLIKPLTEWVVEAGLRLNQAWDAQGCALPIAINLSARNLRDEDLLEKIRQLQSSSGMAAGLLELEVTESAVMEDAEFALRVLHDLRAEGIPLYIDDFGTGYSSLSYLQMLPVDYIKVDQSFVRDMTLRKDSAAIVRSTIDLAHDLGRKVVAEGVETQAHWDQLAAFGCDIAQGYFIAKPMPPGEFQGWRKLFRPPATGRPEKA